ncbi:MAG: dihydroorotase family protein [Candidatus Lokiarchaeota archaeon]|nr:dihydroorotase family protein [Candidatus Lokiarchaeota archaeon]
MILKNAKIYTGNKLIDGALFIQSGKIQSIIKLPTEEKLENIRFQNRKVVEIDCEKRIILPGIIDIHSHLRDMGQQEKETFQTGTKAALISGITTVLNMPNTKPPAISEDQVKKWMERARNNIYNNVGFISGVPENINEKEIKKILDLGVFGFKIYPLSPLSDINWNDPENLLDLLRISAKYGIQIFIHADYPLPEEIKNKTRQEIKTGKVRYLKIHNELYPEENEARFVKYVLTNYEKFINDNDSPSKNLPKIHFCHISCEKSYKLLSNLTKDFDVSFEVTPHHLLLSQEIELKNESFGKVLPPLRKKSDVEFLFGKLKKGEIEFIGTDHAPHTLKEKSQQFFKAPSGFPGFETYPLKILDKVFKNLLPIEYFVKAASENPANKFSIFKKGVIKEGYDADLLIIEKIKSTHLNSASFVSKANYTPFENSNTLDRATTVLIWKIILGGSEISVNDHIPKGKMIYRSII